MAGKALWDYPLSDRAYAIAFGLWRGAIALMLLSLSFGVRAIAALDAPSEVIEIIERAVSNDPAERQPNAEVLLTQVASYAIGT